MHTKQCARRHQQESIHHLTTNCDLYSVFNQLTGPALLEQAESLLTAHREWLLPGTAI